VNTKLWLEKFGPFTGLLVVWLLFAALCGGHFSAWENQRLMLLQTAVVGLAAVGATMVIISGGIDLSVGSVIALGGMVVAWLLKEAKLAPWLAGLGGLGAGLLCGLVTGSLVTGSLARVASVILGILAGVWVGGRYGVSAGLGAMLVSGVSLWWLGKRLLPELPLSPFIVTLGMWGALRGLAKGLGGNQPIYPEQTWLNQLMQSSTTGLSSLLAPGVLIMLFAAILGALLLRYTRFGRHLFAVGSNELTAHLCGVDVAKTKLWVYILATGLAGLAGLLQFAFLYGQGDPSTAEGYELKVIAAVVVGGASLAGGRGTVFGTLVGSLIMTVVDNGCTKLGLDNWVQEIVTGAIIVSAVALDQWRQRRGVQS
jgi:ribose/xylose/arabinose/galactoside ABC-type transport system permease subunit